MDNVSNQKHTGTFLEQFKEIHDANPGECVVCGEKPTSDPDYDLNRPGIEVQEGNSSYERAGVSHLIHAWHEKVKKGPKVSVKILGQKIKLTDFY
jgi:hypothetical protein